MEYEKTSFISLYYVVYNMNLFLSCQNSSSFVFSTSLTLNYLLPSFWNGMVLLTTFCKSNWKHSICYFIFCQRSIHQWSGCNSAQTALLLFAWFESFKLCVSVLKLANLISIFGIFAISPFEWNFGLTIDQNLRLPTEQLNKRPNVKGRTNLRNNFFKAG